MSMTLAQGHKPDNTLHKVIGLVNTLKGIDKRGFLSSKGSGKKWQRRYFALKANILYEFEEETVTASVLFFYHDYAGCEIESGLLFLILQAEGIKSAIDLKGFTVRTLEDEKQPFAFSVRQPSSEDEKAFGHTLCGDSQEEMNAWVEALRKAIASDQEVELDSFEGLAQLSNDSNTNPATADV